MTAPQQDDQQQVGAAVADALAVPAMTTARDAVLAAAITWWGDQIHTADMPDGSEHDLAAACDAYMAALGMQFDTGMFVGTPAAAALERMQARHRDDCGGA